MKGQEIHLFIDGSATSFRIFTMSLQNEPGSRATSFVSQHCKCLQCVALGAPHSQRNVYY